MPSDGTFDRAPANATLQLSSLDSDNLMAEYREQIFYRLAILALVGLVPFVVNALVDGSHLVGGIGLAVFVALAIDVWAIRKKAPPPIPYLVLFVPMMANTAAWVVHQGLVGVLWAYPLLLMVHFAVEDRVANAVNGLFVAALTVTIGFYVDIDSAIRVIVTLGLTIGAANIFSRLATKLQRRLQTMSIIDPLTGAYNRRYLYLYLSDALARRDRSSAEASLLLLDLDHFKRVNDDFGHTTGDRVLIALVRTLRESLRRVDTVFRLGGEEFAVVLPDTGPADAERVAEKLRLIVADTPILDRRPITVSVGCAPVDGHEDPVEWLKTCDEALYEAKSRGRNCVVLSGGRTPTASVANAH